MASAERVSHISKKRGQFRYFDRQLGGPNWRQLTILDFGGNIGNLLTDAGSRLDPEHYWCMDVSSHAIEIGRRKHPRAHWVHYDRYNYCFNSGGIPGLKLPTLGRTFDYILAYSVFTHVVPSEMQELIAALSSRIHPGGRLAFTFIDPSHRSWATNCHINNFQWRLERAWGPGREHLVENYLVRVADQSWFAFVDDLELYFKEDAIPPRTDQNEISSFHVFHRTALIRQLFPTAKILGPVCGEMQHCCIIQG
jgi:2-polyprenyl-3-methyl-5-hydroxy-6-metoxy-1,4-benzoquinol methylase